ncbi:hypothetical protein KIN20_036075 [Parelaphostrongylus tenuis]|uniref:Uncharacterized protein n=1 Tax=Parelaphostrongylus tenuis TaxID=148309 RepID=A0AAD5RCC1_PARTN|nr:hypothetical protein KIN20_036075 [Parelaphostrongylus tenuis]
MSEKLRPIVLWVVMQFTILCERTVATLWVHKYEKHGGFFVFAFLIMAGLIIMTILAITYRHEDFNELTFSMLNTPTSAAPRIRFMFILLGAISIFVIIGMQVLLRINKKRKARIDCSLSSRYQVHENMFITHFASYLSLLQLTIYVLYSYGGLSMRAAQHLLFGTNEIAFGAARGVFYLIPLFTFLLPLLTIYLHRKHRTERQLSINANICLKSTGGDGVCNYQDVISKAWRV